MLDNQHELFIVVDKEDKILGYRSRYDCHHDKSMIHRVVGIIITNNKNQILLQKRSKLKDMYPGYFTIAASGHVTKGQSYEEAARREMSEEIGIENELKFHSKFISISEKETEMVSLFTGINNGPFSIAEDEVESVQFVEKEAIKKMKETLTPMAKTCFEKVGLL